MNYGGGRAAGDESGTLNKRTRDNGFYWVSYSGASEPDVARYFSDGDDFRVWYLPAYDGWLEEAEVTVLSERLLPPEVKSNG